MLLANSGCNNYFVSAMFPYRIFRDSRISKFSSYQSIGDLETTKKGVAQVKNS